MSSQPINRSPQSSSRRGSRRGRRKWLKVAVSFLALILIIFLGTVIAVKSIITEEFLVDEIEKAINSEVEIGNVEVSVFSFPTSLTLSQVELSPKADSSTAGSVKIDSLELEVNFWKLITKHIDVSKITIKRAEITSTYFEDGRTSLGEMFRSPKKKKKKSEGSSDDDDQGGFNAFEQEEFVASLGGLIIQDSRADITLEKTGLRIRCDDVNLALSAITIDPNNLQNTNTAKLNLSSMVKLHSTKGWHYGDIEFSGEATARIFNPVTGDSEPDIEGHINLAKSSWLNTRVPVITKAWKTLTILEKVGIKVAPLPERATFGRSSAVAAHFHKGKITVREPLSIWVGDWELAALDDSWLQTETDQHEINAELVASVKSSERFFGLIRKVVQYLPSDVSDTLIKSLKNKLFLDDRLIVKIKSSGEFSDPKIRVTEGVPDLEDEAKKAGKDILKEKAGDFLRGLLDR